jgi:hypothetical protein
MCIGRKIMNAREFRSMAERCRELQRVAVRDDVREQLRQWAEDFEAEAETVDKAPDYSAARRKP